MSVTVNYTIIGDRIRETRKSQGFTQEKLAELAEIEPSHLSHIERAATKVSLPTLLSIANALGVSLDELVYGNLKKSSHVSANLISDLLSGCTPEELIALAEVIKTVKKVLRASCQT